VQLAGDEAISAGRTVFVPEAWQRAETERDNQLQVVKIAGGFAIALGALAALIFAVISWNLGHVDKRALGIVGAIVVAVAVIDLGNSWPETAMRLQTAEPVVTQWATAIGAKLVAALLIAGLLALLSGVGSWFARSRSPVPLATGVPAWASGVAVALVVSGLAAAFEMLAPRTAPLWPSLSMATLAWPVVGVIVYPLGLVWVSGIALFMLYLMERGTRGWTRHVALAALLLVLIACAGALAGGSDPLAAVLRGVVRGVVSFLLVWQVLRYDLRAIPAFVATEMLLEAARNAALDGTPGAWGLFALGAAITVAVAWAITRYVGRPLPDAARA
jgi:hypothetical protein